MTPIPVPPASARPAFQVLQLEASPDKALFDAAQRLEATFLSEMLKNMSFDTITGGFGSNQGAEQFGSFLRDAQAREITDAGGIGLAEVLFKAMVARADV